MQIRNNFTGITKINNFQIVFHRLGINKMLNTINYIVDYCYLDLVKGSVIVYIGGKMINIVLELTYY